MECGLVADEWPIGSSSFVPRVLVVILCLSSVL